MREFIEELIENKKWLYQKTPREMVGEYNREQDTIKGYNGRQLLELLQNCDDEGSTEVLIKLDSVKKCISISNKGTPFSEAGYESLFTANLSGKRNKRQYIGNKGLGFRSIINWSDTIEIHSNNIALKYSESNRVRRFNELFNEEEQKQIRHKHNISKKAFPIPYLTMPEVVPVQQNGYVTSIFIYYKDTAFDSILEQVEAITSETLLFLNCIEIVRFIGFDGKDNINCSRQNIPASGKQFMPAQTIDFDDTEWFIFEEEEELPEEYWDKEADGAEFYQIKIAVEKNFSTTSPFLYSFFPTNIQLEQPFILHATFDLDSTRNQIVKSKKNKYLLKKVVDFTVRVAKYYARDNVSYKPLEILNHEHKADTLENLGYYEMVNSAIVTEEIFPCIDNTYRKLEDVVYISDSFGEMLQKIKATEILSYHILPLKDFDIESLSADIEIDDLTAVNDPLELVNEIAGLQLTNKQRAYFINEVVANADKIYDFDHDANFLVNEQGDLIEGKEYIYTPVTRKAHLMTPTFANIQFINSELFRYLLKYFGFKDSGSTNKGRFIAEQLEKFCNIHSYEPITLAQKIIAETNRIIKFEPKKAVACVKEMNACLFHNFKLMEEETRRTKLRVPVHTITISKKLKLAEDVIISIHYPKGVRTASIFKTVYSADDYVASPVVLGINEPNNIALVEEYLFWLNVNLFARYRKFVKQIENNYFWHIQKVKGIRDSTGHQLTYWSIENFELILKKISVIQLILWVYHDHFLRKQLSDQHNEDEVKNHYRGYHIIYNKPSYIKYLFTEKYRFKFYNFLIDEKYTWINDISIDYRAKEFIDNNISKSNINEILVLLGAKDDFHKISTRKLAEIINKLPKQYPDGTKSQSFYKKALGHYRLNRNKFDVPLLLFANDGNELRVYNNDEIYFSDKIRLPRKLMIHFPIFNFPSRAGGAEAIDFFRINDLKDLEINITTFSILKSVTSDFSSYFKKLKPLILAQRLNYIEDTQQQKTQVLICDKLKVIFCSKLLYKVGDLKQEASDYEFLHLKDYTYYIKIKTNDTVDSLRKTPQFAETFADIINVSFDISGEKGDFKNLIRYEYEEVLTNTKHDYGEDAYFEAREMLGLSDYKSAFWDAIFRTKGVPYEGVFDDSYVERILKNCFQDFSFDTESLNYEKLDDEEELLKVAILFDNLQLSPAEFANNYQYKISFEKLHFQKLKNAILSRKQEVKCSIWKLLVNKEIGEQATFLELLNRYEQFEEFASKKAMDAKMSLFLDVDTLVKQYLSNQYGGLLPAANINLDKIKKKNLSLFNKDERFDINQSERYRSLIYFESAIPTIRTELSESRKQAIEEELRESDPQNFYTPEIISSDKLRVRQSTSYSQRRRKGPFVPKAQNERAQKEKGISSENIVFEHLNKIEKDVYLASEDDEGLHYDIRYTDKEGNIKFVEVKTFDNGSFYLSKDEYDFGKDNLKNYEIWLVKNKTKIIPVKDFFTNSKYLPVINEYIVHLDIDL